MIVSLGMLGEQIPYGKTVEKLDADAAVRKYRPKVVIACWVTHRFDPAQPHAGGMRDRRR